MTGLLPTSLKFSRHLTLVAALIAIGLVLAAHPRDSFGIESQIMPLAEKSLLLDGQVIGDRIIIVGERGHILLSDDQGVSWQQQPVPTRASLTSVFFVDRENGWAAGHDSTILRSRDGGQHWQQVYSDPEDERPILDLWFRDSEHGYAVGAYGLFLSTEDGGESWQQLDFTPATMRGDDVSAEAQDEDAEMIDFHLNQITATEKGRVFVAAEAGHLYRSDDGCQTWISLPSPYEGSFYGSLPLGPAELLAFGLRGNLFRSDDSGRSWTEVQLDSQATLNDGIRLQDGRIALAGLAGVLFVSEDGGHSFKLQKEQDRSGIAKVLQAADGALILIGEHGVKRLPLPAAGKGAAQ